MTRWAAEVRPDLVLPEYPRPQMVRKRWLNLNGLWDYAITAKDAGRPERSGTARSSCRSPSSRRSRAWQAGRAGQGASGIAARSTCPRTWRGRRVLLHFGAVDWESTVWVNGHEVGTHRGGYDPFTFDITDALEATARSRRSSCASAIRPTTRHACRAASRSRSPHGILYTAVTGIWQTVWLEPVPRSLYRPS